MLFELSADATERVDRYISFVNQWKSAKDEAAFIGSAVERNQLTGESNFIDEVEHRTGLRVEFRGQGRPAAVEK